MKKRKILTKKVMRAYNISMNKDMFGFIAHTDTDSDKTQSLHDHLINTAIAAAETGKKIGCENLLFVIGLLHDIGKADPLFQNYIKGEYREYVNHSGAGGKFIADFTQIRILPSLTEKSDRICAGFFLHICAYVVFAHHGLFDILGSGSHYGENNFKRRLDYFQCPKYRYADCVIEYTGYLDSVLQKRDFKKIEEYLLLAFNEFKTIYAELKELSAQQGDVKEQRTEFHYYIHCTVRLFLSILKDADIYDTVNAFEFKQEKPSAHENIELWKCAVNNIENLYDSYKKSSTPLNNIRTDLAERAKEQALKSGAGIYKIELPTGAGKTKLALRCALHNALNFEKERIFYTAPFLSVLEQNSEEIKKIIGKDERVLEHHSNAVQEDVSDYDENTDENISYIQRQYLLDSWDSPVILTTSVQFLNTLYKGKASNIRRFSKLINSVIIIDEVQNIPPKTIYNFNLMMNFMKTLMHCTVFHCTATQPRLDYKHIAYPIRYGDKGGHSACIIECTADEKTFFDRVCVTDLGREYTDGMKIEQLADHILHTLTRSASVLAVLNTKRSVRKLYDLLRLHLQQAEYDVYLYYLTTNMCAQHRKDVIAEIKKNLSGAAAGGKKLICVSTQLIEAGVDLDFHAVYRSLTGLDSCIQTAGRCNREGKLDKGDFYLCRLTDEQTDSLPEIKDKAVFAADCLRSVEHESEINLDNIIPDFYARYYANSRLLDYPVGKDRSSLLEMLSFNEAARSSYYTVKGSVCGSSLAQAFDEAARTFEVIDNTAESVIVYYGESKELISALYEACEQYDFAKIKMILRKLQRYMIQIRNIKVWKGVLECLLPDESIKIVTENYYRTDIGAFNETCDCNFDDFIL